MRLSIMLKTLFFGYDIHFITRLETISDFLIDEFDAVVFVLAKHVCFSVFSF